MTCSLALNQPFFRRRTSKTASHSEISSRVNLTCWNRHNFFGEWFMLLSFSHPFLQCASNISGKNQQDVVLKVDVVSQVEGSKEFVKTYKVGNTAEIGQWSATAMAGFWPQQNMPEGFEEGSKCSIVRWPGMHGPCLFVLLGSSDLASIGGQLDALLVMSPKEPY